MFRNQTKVMNMSKNAKAIFSDAAFSKRPHSFSRVHTPFRNHLFDECSGTSTTPSRDGAINSFFLIYYLFIYIS
jgi:hypothetical protein